MRPQFPIYIVSKGRAESRYTARALDSMGVPYWMIVEAQEYEAYAAVLDRSKLLILPSDFQQAYDTCDDLGASKSRGPGPARNFAWWHSMEIGSPWHWVMDDNIRLFYRLHQNHKIPCLDGALFLAMECWCQRYVNVAMGGPAYEFFVPRKAHHPPFIMNTRIYSCNLIRNDLPFRWRARYNEDTDLSLRLLKAGWCTVQFTAFLQKKITTQVVKGGCTRDFYEKEGTGPKSQMLVNLHPDCSRMVTRFGRTHHHVNYARFKRNRLVLAEGLQLQPGSNDFGMTLTGSPRMK